MPYINIEVWDATGNKKKPGVEVPDDVPINRLLVVLVDRLNYPRHDGTGGQLLSYKLHHKASGKQLLDDQTLSQSGVKDGDILRLTPEIVAGGVSNEYKIIHIDDSDSEKTDRFARFKLISWWEQERLKKAKILVVGAGALGNEILKNLALLGIGNIFIADMDTIENSNLSRSVLFREKDNGSRKSEVAAKAIKDIYPDINIQWFQGNIIFDLGLGVYEWADIVIAGLDNREARLHINRCCWKTNTPWIDGAIEQLNGVVRVFIPPDSACYECTMGKADWEILKARMSCNFLTRDEMLLGKVPTTPTSASVIAGIQCQEAVKLLHGLEVLEGKGYIFNGLTHDSYVINYTRKEDCLSHVTYSNIRNLHKSVAGITLRELLLKIKKELGDEAIIEFNNDIIETLECTICGTSESLFKSLGKVKEKEAICPSCGEVRNPKTLHSIGGNEEFLDKTFAEVGIPPLDIVVGRNNMNEIFLEFDQDASAVLGNLYATI